MKKSIFALLLAFCIMAVMLVGCTATDATPDEVAPTETVAPQPQYTTVTLDAFSYNGVEYRFIFEEKYGEGSRQVFLNNISFAVNQGDVIADVFADNNYSKMELEEAHDEFLGWMEYKQTLSDDGVTSVYEKTSDTLYSNDELLKKTAPDYSVVYVARWADIDDEYYAAYGY